ncbi:hypothetical protein [Actinacidiphila oryziradicis]|uniref:hypothetical protein n=1 Tax=Actinacidiphila oryziradicis TaxID=2571141 RepID=UPI0023EFB132|nr:hypothetical protein [Actinacidiphila oryziradicis]MCW2872147.1 hypothetical protein [Actinacidiphila oryziradicis]
MVRISALHRHSRLGAVLAAASAAVAFLGLVATFSPGNSGHSGHIAVGAVGASPGPTANIPPDEGVALVPLDPSGSRSPSASRPDPAAIGTSAGTGAGTGADGTDASHASAIPTTGADAPQSSPSAPGGPSVPAKPAHLIVSAVERTPEDVRWCERVTVTFRNTGDRAATSGAVVFGTHIIDAFGIDWATVGTDEPVPVPITGGAKREKAWEVCVDAWRVPLGMHIETQDVSLA